MQEVNETSDISREPERLASMAAALPDWRVMEVKEVESMMAVAAGAEMRDVLVSVKSRNVVAVPQANLA